MEAASLTLARALHLSRQTANVFSRRFLAGADKEEAKQYEKPDCGTDVVPQPIRGATVSVCNFGSGDGSASAVRQ
jgi:hypothetical protein